MRVAVEVIDLKGIYVILFTSGKFPSSSFLFFFLVLIFSGQNLLDIRDNWRGVFDNFAIRETDIMLFFLTYQRWECFGYKFDRTLLFLNLKGRNMALVFFSSGFT